MWRLYYNLHIAFCLIYFCILFNILCFSLLKHFVTCFWKVLTKCYRVTQISVSHPKRSCSSEHHRASHVQHSMGCEATWRETRPPVGWGRCTRNTRRTRVFFLPMSVSLFLCSMSALRSLRIPAQSTLWEVERTHSSHLVFSKRCCVFFRSGWFSLFFGLYLKHP